MAFIAIATFVLILSIVIAPYWLLIVRPEEQEIARLKGRLVSAKKQNRAVAGLLRETERLSTVPFFHAVLTRASGVIQPMQETIQQSGIRTTLGTILLASGCLAGIAYLLVLRVTQQPLIGLLAAALVSTLPYVYVRRARTKRLAKFEEQFPEAIDLLARALRAGHALTTGLQMVGDELPDPIRGEFRQLYDQQSYGLPLPDALRSFARRVPLIDAKFFVTALLTQREAGGNLAEVLDNLASIIRDRFRVKRQVRVISAHGRITGWVLAGLPPTLALVLSFMIPENYRNFYTDPLGIRMLVGAAVMQIIGTLIIRKIVNIEY
jgi:tight adherence protein B